MDNEEILDVDALQLSLKRKKIVVRPTLLNKMVGFAIAPTEETDAPQPITLNIERENKKKSIEFLQKLVPPPAPPKHMEVSLVCDECSDGEQIEIIGMKESSRTNLFKGLQKDLLSLKSQQTTINTITERTKETELTPKHKKEKQVKEDEEDEDYAPNENNSEVEEDIEQDEGQLGIKDIVELEGDEYNDEEGVNIDEAEDNDDIDNREVSEESEVLDENHDIIKPSTEVSSLQNATSSNQFPMQASQNILVPTTQNDPTSIPLQSDNSQIPSLLMAEPSLHISSNNVLAAATPISEPENSKPNQNSNNILAMATPISSMQAKADENINTHNIIAAATPVSQDPIKSSISMKRQNDADEEEQVVPRQKKYKKLINDNIRKWYLQKLKENHPSIKDIQQNKQLKSLFETEAELGSDDEENDNIIKPINRNHDEENEIGLDEDLDEIINNDEKDEYNHFEAFLTDALQRDNSDLAKVILRDFKNKGKEGLMGEMNEDFKEKLIEEAKQNLASREELMDMIQQKDKEYNIIDTLDRDNMSDTEKQQNIEMFQLFNQRKTLEQINNRKRERGALTQKIKKPEYKKPLVQSQFMLTKRLAESNSLCPKEKRICSLLYEDYHKQQTMMVFK